MSVQIFLSFAATAQTSSSSPYSRYGIGDLQFGGFTKNIGMGGTSFGYNPNYNLNLSNPASYSSLALTTFEIAVSMNQAQLKTDSKTQNSNSSSLSYFAFGFPVKFKKWGTCFGLLPYSNVGYTIHDQQYTSDGTSELHTYDGSGGLNQFFIGNAYSPFKNFSIGANASYLFGVINQQRRIEYPYNSYYFSTRVTQATSVGSLYFNFGIQYTIDSLRWAPSDSILSLNKKLKSIHDSLVLVIDTLNQSSADQKGNWEAVINKLDMEYEQTDSLKKFVVHRKEKSDWSLTLGFTGSPATSLSATNSSLAESFIFNAFDEIIVRDTVENISNVNGKIKLPFSAGFGVMLKQGSRWLIGSDFSLQNWKDYSSFGVNDALANSWRVSAGAQLTPNDRTFKSYWKNVQYRIGFHYEQTYLQLRDNRLNEYAVSIGLGLPVKRSAAMLHLSAEAGRRGTVSNNLIEENFIKLG
ncbi:MAG: hypothetical protein NT126_06560 [Bacteroidetes bacterium]|nr:hypothetical protein [Bacteroidota bacterium]